MAKVASFDCAARTTTLLRSGCLRIFGAASRNWVVVAILLIALAARAYGLTFHSLWFDEVMSTVWAARPAGEIWRVGLALVQDKHPPLYYLALHGWTALFGPGDGAVRSLGVIIGALAVLPAYGIGVMLGGRRAGAFGALLVALNPFLVWYSQEARMFMPATTCALVGLWGVLRSSYCVISGRDAQLETSTTHYALRTTTTSAALMIAGLTAALYTYLFSAFLLPVAAAWVVWGWWQGRRTSGAGWRLGLGLAALVAVAILFMPLARAAWQVSGGEAQPGQPFMAMGPALWRMLQVYTVGWPGWSELAMIGVGIGAVGLLVVGVLAPHATALLENSHPSPHSILSGIRRRLPDAVEGCARREIEAAIAKPHPSTAQPKPGCCAQDASARNGMLCFAAFAGLWLLLPLLLGGLLLARDRTVFAETRYFIFLAPALCLAWGRGIAWVWERRRAAGITLAALVFGVTLTALPANWSPANRREAWRETAAYVQVHAGPNDAILIQPDYVRPAFDRYFAGTQPIFQPFTGPLSSAQQVDGPLAGLADYSTVWVIQSHHQDLDPEDFVVGWFAARYPLATELFPAGIAARAFVQRYRYPMPPPAPGCSACGDSATLPDDPGLPLAADQLRLLACDYQPAELPARETVFHAPSNWIHVVTAWRTGDHLPRADLFPRARLVDAGGQVWGERLERANDTLHVWPTSRWQPGEIVRVDYDVNLNPVTPPGRYRLVIEMAGEQAVCGEVTITR